MIAYLERKDENRRGNTASHPATAQPPYAQLSRWFRELDWEQWDSEIEQDSNTGMLDFLAEQAAKAKADGMLRWV